MIRFPEELGLCLKPPVTDQQLQQAELLLGFALPAPLKALLELSNGLGANEGDLYEIEALAVSNWVWQIALYAPGYVAIGETEGGTIALLAWCRPSSPVYVADSHDLNPAHFRQVAGSLEAWLNAGCPFGPAVPETPLDVYLVRAPGARGLRLLRQAFCPDTALAELQAQASKLPALLSRRVAPRTFKKIAREIGDLVEALEASESPLFEAAL